MAQGSSMYEVKLVKPYIMKAKSLLILLFLASSAFAQDINMAFSSADENYTLDSITAMNIRTKEAITIGGDEILTLGSGTGIWQLQSQDLNTMIYPNPSMGKSILVVNIPEHQDILISVRNQLGQVVCQTEQLVKPGSQAFSISLKSAGIYFISIQHSKGTESLQLISSCNSDANMIYGIGHPSLEPAPVKAGVTRHSSFKSGTEGNFLPYIFGDPVRFYCHSGVHTTILQDQPREIKDYHYDVDFYPCIDADGKYYPVVLINDQIWMAENLAYIQEVSPPSLEEADAAHCYVYGYEGSNKQEALASENCKTYGVLYNWEAANSSCPTGWHLSTDEDWKSLESFLGMSDNELDALNIGRYTGNVAAKLKSLDHWEEEGNGDDLDGFNLLPGGWSGDGHFQEAGIRGSLWTSHEADEQNALFRSFGSASDGNSRMSGGKQYGASVRCVKD